MSEDAVRRCILPTWQTAAAIAMHAHIPTKTAWLILQSNAAEWGLEMKRTRTDGHNYVSMWRSKSAPVVIFGVNLPHTEPQCEPNRMKVRADELMEWKSANGK